MVVDYLNSTKQRYPPLFQNMHTRPTLVPVFAKLKKNLKRIFIFKKKGKSDKPL